MTVRKALVVGIDDYPDNSLNGCCNDSAALKSLLERNGNGNPNFDVRQVNNVKSKAEFRDCIEECFSGNADVALFYYSGHGHIDAIGGYLVTPDCSSGDPGVSLADVLTIANNSKCGERIIILDSCYSGFMGSVNTAGQDTATIRQGVTILTASRSTESSMEIDGHGVFTSLLIEALKGGALQTSLAESLPAAFIHMSTKPSALGTSALFSRPMSQGSHLSAMSIPRLVSGRFGNCVSTFRVRTPGWNSIRRLSRPIVPMTSMR